MNRSTTADRPFEWQSPRDVHVWSASVDAWQDRLPELNKCLARDERERAARYRFAEHRDQYALGRGLLRWLLAQYLGGEPDRWEFGTGPVGKPFVRREPGAETIEFNLTNSHGHVLLAFCPSFPVGIDLEQARDLDDLDGLARRYFSPEEQADLGTIRGAEQRYYFFTVWTLKEAFIKGTGAGMTMPLDTFYVRRGVSHEPPGIHVPAYEVTRKDCSTPQAWRLYGLPCEAGFTAALAVEWGESGGQIKHRSTLAAWEQFP